MIGRKIANRHHGFSRIGGHVCCLLVAAVCLLPSRLMADVTAGRLALEDGFYQLADQVFRDVLQDADSDAAALAAHYILRSHYEQSRFDQLGTDLEQFAADGILKRDALSYWRAVRLSGLEDWKGVTDALKGFGRDAVENASPYTPSALRLKALAHFKRGDVDQASGLFETLDTAYTNVAARAQNRLDWGRTLLAAGETEAAQTVWQPLLSATNLPVSMAAESAYWAGRTFLLADEFSKTIALLRPMMTDVELPEPMRMRMATALAEAFRETGDVAAGTKVLTNTLAAIENPAFVIQSEYALVTHLLAAGKLDAAAGRVRDFVAAHPREPLSPRLLSRLGAAFLDAERYVEAADAFQQQLEAFGDNSGAIYRGKALALAGLSRHGEAALLFERAAAMQTDREAALASQFRAGDSYFANRQYNRALTVYRGVKTDFVAMGQSNMAARAMFQAAASLAALGNTDEAIREFEAIAEAFPTSPRGLDGLVAAGDLHLETGAFETAEAVYQRVMDTRAEGPVFWKALHGRGMARYRRWAPNSIADFERVAAEAAGTPLAEHAHFMRAMCLYRLGRDQQALDICHDFLKRFPESEWAAPVQFWVARLEYNAGNDASAETAFLTFVEAYPDHELAAQALLRAGLASLRRQEYLQAIALFGRMAKQYPTSQLLADARFHQAEAMVQLGRYAAAILVYEEVINNYPDRELAAMALGRRGDCQFTLAADDPARYKEAELSYQSLLQTPGLALDDALQAAYKLGLTYEKLGQDDAALEQYYSGVMLPFLVEKENGLIPGEPARVWFSRAARAAAAIVESRQDWRRLVRILERVVSAEVEFSSEAKKRIKAVKSDYWWMFY